MNLKQRGEVGGERGKGIRKKMKREGPPMGSYLQAEISHSSSARHDSEMSPSQGSSMPP